MNELEKKVREVAELARNTLLKTGEFELAALGFRGNDCFYVQSQGVANSGEAKERFCEYVSKEFLREGVEVCVVASEAWMLAGATEKPEGSLADHPDRIEVLVIFGHNLLGESLILSFPLSRDAQGGVISFGEETLAWGGEGRFVEILRPAAPRGSWAEN